MANIQQVVNQPSAECGSDSKMVPRSPTSACHSRNTRTDHRRAAASLVAATRADESSEPAHQLQVIEAVRIGGEPGLELAARPRLVLAGTRGGHSPILLRLNGDPHRLMSALSPVARLTAITEELPVQWVEISLLGAPPVQRIERATASARSKWMVQSCAGLVSGNFQPFLEAVRGYEVMSVKSTFTKGEGERADS